MQLRILHVNGSSVTNGYGCVLGHAIENFTCEWVLSYE